MDEAKEIAAWNHTAFMAAHVININSPKGTRPAQPQDFHPYGRKRRQQQHRGPGLAAAICPGQSPVKVSSSAFAPPRPKGQ